MPTCDMCGKEAELAKARIEGTLLEVCGECARFGEIIEAPRIRSKNIPASRPVSMPRRKEVIQMLIPDYAQKIKAAREKKGMTQEEFAKWLNEKVSIMQKAESGQFKPSIEMARKLERMLGIALVEQYGEGGEIPLSSVGKKDEGFTLGDFIKDKRKNK
ncbi:multiprotein bridging factor aMBF1 [Candidatus Woesearchaeota archaeon]|nr:multiprotein bridging factor aMBF1 [Candidatus Woesearchaeota archaeon]